MLNEDSSQTGQTEASSVCRFYASGKWCKFGKRCRYEHVRNVDTSLSSMEKDEAESVPTESQNEDMLHITSTEKKERKHQSTNNPGTEIKDGICKFYFKTGRCRFDLRCHYKHEQPASDTSTNTKDSATKDVSSDEKTAMTKQADQKQGNTDKKKTKKLCKYFRAGQCTMGNRCRFRHPTDIMEDVTPSPEDDEKDLPDEGAENVSGQPLTGGEVKPKTQPVLREAFVPQTRVSRSKATQEELKKLRDTEISQLKKRFTGDRLVIKEYLGIEEYRVTFSSSDPDWPFDVNSVEFVVLFPDSYPKEPFVLEFPEDQCLPDQVRCTIATAAGEWVDAKFRSLEDQDRCELALRPFLRWLDKNMEELFTEGLMKLKRELVAKAAGFEFVPATKPAQPERKIEQLNQILLDEVQLESDDESSETNDDDSDDDDDDDEENKSPTSNISSLDPVKRGTEAKLVNLQLLENAATLVPRKVAIQIQCSRCKNRSEVTTPENRVNCVECSKCGNEQLCSYRPALMHSISSVLGYFDLEGCVAFDMVLVDCEFDLGCLNCSKEFKLQGLPTGQIKDTWCKFCHAKMRVACEAVKFHQLQPGDQIDKSQSHMVVKRPTRIPKDPAIKEGFPLPDNGTCKHYKKSFRWLRFPCCGKAYPCDLCHDDKETDHDMKYANRMICGFCCREQPYASDRPCVACNSAMRKQTSAHWEGGKGCRDKIAMSRSDAQKYANLNKTVSRKVQEKKAGSRPKNTKLRHT